MTRRQTPSEKKKRDRQSHVDMFRENQKSWRRNLPRKRRALEKAYRQRVREELAKDDQGDTSAIRRGALLKRPTPTLDDAIDLKLARRLVLQQNPRRTEDARLRRAAKRRHGSV